MSEIAAIGVRPASQAVPAGRRKGRVMIPTWLLDILAAVMLAVVALSATRLAVARPWRQGVRRVALADVDVAHLLMALAMAGMLTPSLTTLPDDAWAVIFGVLAVWFASRVILDARVSGARALAGGHCAPHLIHAAAMMYMFLSLDKGVLELPGSGVGLRAGADRLQHLGPRPALRPRPQRALQPGDRPGSDARPAPPRGPRHSRAPPPPAWVPPPPAWAPPQGPAATAWLRPAGCRPPASAPREAAPGFSPRGSPSDAGSRWASPWRSCC